MINVISVPQALGVQFTATPKARRGPCIAVPQGAAVVPIILLILNFPYQSHCYQISKVIVTKFPKSLLPFFLTHCYQIFKTTVTDRLWNFPWCRPYIKQSSPFFVVLIGPRAVTSESIVHLLWLSLTNELLSLCPLQELTSSLTHSWRLMCRGCSRGVNRFRPETEPRKASAGLSEGIAQMRFLLSAIGCKFL